MALIKETNLKFWSSTQQKKPNKIILHHSGPSSQDVTAIEVHQWHLNQGRSGIGYHFLIRRDGTIERGRPEWTMGAHTSGFNKDSIGICFAGNLDEMEFTKAQMECGAMLIADLATRHELNINANTVVGHKDLLQTTCPGKNLYSQMGTLRGKAICYQQNPCW